MSQPTLSSHVAALEAAYAVRLFERRGRALELTALGRDLHDVTTRLFELEDEAQRATRDNKDGDVGESR